MDSEYIIICPGAASLRMPADYTYSSSNSEPILSCGCKNNDKIGSLIPAQTVNLFCHVVAKIMRTGIKLRMTVTINNKQN